MNDRKGIVFKKAIPSRLKASLMVLFGRAKAVPIDRSHENREAKYVCPVCDQQVHSFKPLDSLYFQKFNDMGFIHSVYQFETLNISAYSCPFCGASDRERLYAIYIKDNFISSDPNIKLLDIAPGKALQQLIINRWSGMYRSADFEMQGVDDEVDITNMSVYQDSSFDFFICSHVLEHVENDVKAISELFRILRSGGKGIVMAPILLTLKTDYENPDATTADDRWKHFGQDDHVRMYSKSGFIQKLTDAGFKVSQLGIDNYGKAFFYKNGIHKRSVLYVVKKPENM
nr:methyltransferase domain-containing protein [uncultured Desulfobacter sp.]